MKRRTVTAFLMSLCLAVSVPGSVGAADLQSLSVTADPQSAAEQNAEILELTLEQRLELIEKRVAAAAEQTEPDMDSATMKEFLEASNEYDTLSTSEKEQLSGETRSNLALVRKRIAQKIYTADGVTVDSPDWYVKTQIKESALETKVLELAKELYAGSAPTIVYAKDITYVDVRNEQSYTQKSVVSFRFPVPKNYDSLKNPKIVRYTNGKLIPMEAEREGDTFYVDMVYPLENVFILDVPIALTGIQMDKKISVNAGQKQKLQVTAVPQNATQEYQLEWSSNAPKVAAVDTKGVVTAKKTGTAVITAKVKGTKISVSCTVKVVQGAHALKTPVSEILTKTRKYMQSVDKNPTLGSEWFVFGQARSGSDRNSKYFKTYYNHIANYLKENDGKLTSSVKYTEYSKMILIMTSMGKDARKIAGYNLFEPLADFETVTGQGTNGPIWALIALNSNPAYSIPKVKGVKVQTTEKKLINYILDKETKSGGWSMTGDVPDSDLTGMALQALAPYYHKKGYEQVTAAIDRALEVLSNMQNQKGGYETMGVETSESAAQVLTGLCALGIDPMKDERFVKGGNWIVENLLTYYISGSGFMHVKAGSGNNGGAAAGVVDGIATGQGYYALTAYQRLLENKTSLYDMSDIQLTKGGAGDGKGTGLENKDKKEKDTNKKDSQKSGKAQSDKKDSTKTANTNKKDNHADQTDNASDTKSAASVKHFYQGKQLNLTTEASDGNGKKAKKSSKDSGAWSFDPEDYVENGTDGDNASEQSADLAQGANGAEASSKAGAEKSRQWDRRSLAVFFGGAAVGALAAAGGIWFGLRRSKRKNHESNEKKQAQDSEK